MPLWHFEVNSVTIFFMQVNFPTLESFPAVAAWFRVAVCPVTPATVQWRLLHASIACSNPNFNWINILRWSTLHFSLYNETFNAIVFSLSSAVWQTSFLILPPTPPLPFHSEKRFIAVFFKRGNFLLFLEIKILFHYRRLKENQPYIGFDGRQETLLFEKLFNLEKTFSFLSFFSTKKRTFLISLFLPFFFSTAPREL